MQSHSKEPALTLGQGMDFMGYIQAGHGSCLHPGGVILGFPHEVYDSRSGWCIFCL